jgi:hypothetical protein
MSRARKGIGASSETAFTGSELVCIERLTQSQDVQTPCQSRPGNL